MKNLVARLIGAGVVIGIAFLINSLRDTTSCSGPKAIAWDDATADRIDGSVADYDSFETYDEMLNNTPYVQRAEQRYVGQSEQETIKCLEKLNELIVEFFRLEWKMYEAASEGKYELAYEYDAESADLSAEIEAEFDNLAAEYEDWNVE
jgi:hypothetical protein